MPTKFGLIPMVHAGLFLLAASCTWAQTTTADSGDSPRLANSVDLFVSGTDDTNTFRIPALVTAPNGDLIAGCDARRNSRRDLIWVRDIDIVVKRSCDNGKTWSDMEIVCDHGEGRPASDPSFIVDQTTKEIFCFYNYMDQDHAPKEFRFYLQRSRDNGKSWGKARDITDAISKPAWKMDFKFITSGRGIQRRNGELVHTLVNLQRGLRLFQSRDHGKTWSMIDVPIKPANESKVIELSDGLLLVNSRANGTGMRWIHRSVDHGRTWESAPEPTLVDPGCNASILRYQDKAGDADKDLLIFCNAASEKARKNLTVRVSQDEGASWSNGLVIDSGPAAYSSMTVCRDGSIGILYESGHRAIRFVKVELDLLMNAAAQPSKS